MIRVVTERNQNRLFIAFNLLLCRIVRSILHNFYMFMRNTFVRDWDKKVFLITNKSIREALEAGLEPFYCMLNTPVAHPARQYN